MFHYKNIVYRLVNFFTRRQAIIFFLKHEQICLLTFQVAFDLIYQKMWCFFNFEFSPRNLRLMRSPLRSRRRFFNKKFSSQFVYIFRCRAIVSISFTKLIQIKIAQKKKYRLLPSEIFHQALGVRTAAKYRMDLKLYKIKSRPSREFRQQGFDLIPDHDFL